MLGRNWNKQTQNSGLSDDGHSLADDVVAKQRLMGCVRMQGQLSSPLLPW